VDVEGALAWMRRGPSKTHPSGGRRSLVTYLSRSNDIERELSEKQRETLKCWPRRPGGAVAPFF
jgi:hypothetical protein